MATLIKRANGDMHKICLTDEHVNAQNIQEELYTAGQYIKVEIPTNTANDARHGNIYYTGDAWVDSEDRTGDEAGLKAHHSRTKEEFDSAVASEIATFEQFLSVNPNNAMASDIQTYVDALKALDTSSMTFPLAHSVCSYMESTGVTAFSPLQCP
tara:strand:+ start:6027 stop:6491 length:465 start_codon:yes stop_codon:yes gene_type:complete